MRSGREAHAKDPYSGLTSHHRLGRVDYVLALIVFGIAAAYVVSRPLLRPAQAPDRDEARRQALEAAKEAKYREIRDADMDHRMGKLSDDDYRATDRELRAQAIEILRQLDELAPAESAPPAANL
jgi:succinate dehydrogenase/fumarate reductase flavoprotein subunit